MPHTRVRYHGQLWGPGSARAARARNTSWANNFGWITLPSVSQLYFLFYSFEPVIQGREGLHLRPAMHYLAGWRWSGPFHSSPDGFAALQLMMAAEAETKVCLAFQSGAGGLLCHFLFLSSLTELHFSRCLVKACCI